MNTSFLGTVNYKVRLLIGALLFILSTTVNAERVDQSNPQASCNEHLLGDQGGVLSELKQIALRLDAQVGPHDPFIDAVDFEDTLKILNTLSRGSESAALLLADIRKSLRFGNISESQVKKLNQTFIETYKQSERPRAFTKKELIALKLSGDILLELNRLFLPVPPPPSMSDPNKTKENKEDKAQDKKNNPQTTPTQQFPPELPEEYQIQPDKSNGQSDNQEKEVFYSLNDKIHYFKQREFNFISRSATNFKATALPFKRNVVMPEGTSHIKLKVVTKGADALSLFVPPEYEPINSASISDQFKVIKLQDGSFLLTNPQKQTEIELSLRPRSLEDLSAADLDILLSPIGVSKNEWPKPIQDDLLSKTFSNAQAAAKEVAHYLQQKFLYNKKAPETDPVLAVKKGEFKCDMAALIMVSIMRDHFKFPCRVVAGYRAERDSNISLPNSVLALPSTAHAWVECYEGGKWHTYDPTPIKQAGKDPESNSNNRFLPQDDLDLVNLPEQKLREESNSKNKKDDQETEDAESDDTLSESSDKETPGGKKTRTQNIDTNLQSLSLKAPGGPKLPMMREFIFKLYQESFNPVLTQRQIIENLNHLTAANLYTYWAPLKKILNESVSQLSYSRGSLSAHLRAMASQIHTAPLEDSYKEFYSNWFRTKAFTSLNPNNTPFAMPNALLNLQSQIEAAFRSYESKNAPDIKLAMSFVKSMPKITRELLIKNYNIQNLGNNPATLALAKDLKSKKLTNYSLLRELYPLTDFITEPVQSPLYREVKTWNYRNKKGRDYQIVTNPGRLLSGIPANPSKSRSENFLEGTLIDPLKRQTSKMPDNTGVQDPERVTIVLYDTSGSMGGSPGEFQAALIAAFTDRALSDVSPDGRHRHKLMIMGFDNEVHKATAVTNRLDAEKVIQAYKNELQNTSGGTNIMKALTEAFKQIESAQKLNKEPLANANIILMTDGQADMNVATIKELRAKIDRKTKVQLLFVAINDSNKELKDFTQSEATQQTNLAKSNYYEFSGTKITELVSLASEKETKIPEDLLVLDSNTKSDTKKLYQLLIEAADLAEHYEGLIKLRPTPSLSKIYHLIDTKMTTESRDKKTSQTYADANSLRTTLAQSVNAKATHHTGFTLSMLEVITRFEELTGTKASHLSIEEGEELKHLIREFNAVLSGVSE